MKYVALLRGINVGGKNKLPMKDLAAMFDAAGCTDVVTYIQSGNVVFSADVATAKAIAKTIPAAIQKLAKLDVPVLVRSAKDMQATVENLPYAKKDVDAGIVYVMFLADKPTAAQVAALDPQRSPGDELKVVGRDVYLRLTNGAGRTKITNAWLDAKLATTSTARNWNTTLKLLALASA